MTPCHGLTEESVKDGLEAIPELADGFPALALITPEAQRQEVLGLSVELVKELEEFDPLDLQELSWKVLNSPGL